MPEQLLFNISNKREKERKVWRMWAAVKEKEKRREKEKKKEGDGCADVCYIPHDRQRSLVITQSSTPR
jgi:hypothetical protein